ncbi:VOC family protein [Actinoplanes sichuanensis]|uniref:VOC family protein n=1 Tax=Actinoplanes sichuanensis TaxID=512349 RepID=A0ABW4A3T3_9ACTN|nr:VOC family protein [Actinoplanes sichuanensis]BEL10684.1 VOC family protein [Actinoplanes sichuanensis]
MERFLTRREASEAVADQGWRFVLGTLRTSVPVSSLAEAAAAGTRAVEACGADADEHLRLDLRPNRVSLTLRPRAFGGVTARDTELAGRITEALHNLGLTTTPGDIHPGTSRTEGSTRLANRSALSTSVATGSEGSTRLANRSVPSTSVATSPVPSIPVAARSVQEWEIAIDALDIVSVRPFWKAVLGYTDETGKHGPEDRLVDPWRQGPAVWFQRMTEPRPQRNRIHFDISVPHDEAPGRIAAALAAGGHLVSEEWAPSFWVLADREGNEVCVTTWQGRDP